MTVLSSRNKIPLPQLDDPADLPAAFADAATVLDKFAQYEQGLLADRPVAGIIGRRYRATNDLTNGPNGTIHLDIGSGWVVESAGGSGGSTTPADGSVTTPKIVDGAVTNPKLADLGVGTSKLADKAVTAAKVADALKPSAGAAAGAEALRAIGSGSGQVVAGNDSRLTDQRVPPDGSVTAVKIATALKPSTGAAAGTEALRALGTAAGQALPGNDASVTNQRVPTDGSVTAAKIASSLKPSAGAAAGTEALRALGVTGATAAAGNDSRLSDNRTPVDGSVTLGKLASALRPSLGAPDNVEAVRSLGTGAGQALSGADSRLSDQRIPTDGSVTAAKVAGSLKPSVAAATTDEALRALGTAANTAAAGNDARLSDQRVPTDGSVTNVKVAAGAAIAESKIAFTDDAAPGTASRRTLGSGSQQAARGSDTEFAFSNYIDVVERAAKFHDGASGTYVLGFNSAEQISTGVPTAERVLRIDPAAYYNGGPNRRAQMRFEGYVACGSANPNITLVLRLARVATWGDNFADVYIASVDAPILSYTIDLTSAGGFRSGITSADADVEGITPGPYVIIAALTGGSTSGHFTLGVRLQRRST